MTQEIKHLWEIKHSYYCSEKHYFGTGTSGNINNKYETFSSFLEEFADSDLDLNLVFRWDLEEESFNGDVYYRNGVLKVFFMVQRKGYHHCSNVSVCRADEQAVIEFLKRRFTHLLELWEPFNILAQGARDE